VEEQIPTRSSEILRPQMMVSITGSIPVLTTMSKRYSESSNQDFKNDSAECLRREWDIFGIMDDENLLHRNLDFFSSGMPCRLFERK